MLPLFEEPAAPTVERERIGPGTPEYDAYCKAFAMGARDMGCPPLLGSERVQQYTKDGYRIGRLFRPLPCMKETRG